MPDTEGKLEFSRPLSADRVQAGKTLEESINANVTECAALSRRFGLVALKDLRADFQLRRVNGNKMVEVTGTLTATVTQTCVITLEPVESQLHENLTALFAPPELVPSAESRETDFLAEDDDAPEPLDHNHLDLGELTAQHLCLALDPYPRKPGVSLTAAIPAGVNAVQGEEAAAAMTAHAPPPNTLPHSAKPSKIEEPPANPFAALKDWVKGK